MEHNLSIIVITITMILFAVFVGIWILLDIRGFLYDIRHDVHDLQRKFDSTRKLIPPKGGSGTAPPKTPRGGEDLSKINDTLKRIQATVLPSVLLWADVRCPFCQYVSRYSSPEDGKEKVVTCDICHRRFKYIANKKSPTPQKEEYHAS